MTREQLIASLAITDDTDSVYFDDGRYLDWSCPRDDGRQLEIGNADGDAVNAEFDWDDLARIHRALTLTLLNRETN